MREGDAARGVEVPPHPRESGGSTAHGPGDVHQARAARDQSAGDENLTLIEEVLHRDNMMRALKRVVRNGGAPGVDGLTVDELKPYSRVHWARIREEVLDGRYRPQPVRRVEIPKPGGEGMRMLGIPTVVDRLLQQALLQVLQPLFDPTFSEASFGFRPGRSAHQAVARAREHIEAGHRWVVDMDLEKFFDRVNHDVLMARVARRVKDKRVLRLIRSFLQAGIMDDGVISSRTEGTPQGGPLSPLLSNILLDELDKELERRGHRFVRYADDCNVYVRSRAAGERVMASLERFLEKRLRLQVNRSKSAVDRPWRRTFLGYSFTHHHKPKPKVAPKSLKRLKARLGPVLRRGRGRSLAHVIEELNPILRGWVAYYRMSGVKAGFEKLDTWIRRKLRCIVWRQWKTSRTRFNKLQEHGVNRNRAAKAAWNGRGPWWNAGASHMNLVRPTRWFRDMGLVSLLEEHRRLKRST